MAYKFGFVVEHQDNKDKKEEYTQLESKVTPRKSIVQVYFKDRQMSLAYYNDQFDLKCGDKVYVDGKLEGMLGVVTKVNYNFKIKISDYKRIIAVVDTNVHGQFHMAGSHFITFDRKTLPTSKVKGWFVAPAMEEDEYVSGCDDSSFPLDNLGEMNVSAKIAERGDDYYLENRVRYICLDDGMGYAIVEGTEAYEVEFQYHNGIISNLTCSCYCSYNCKHEFATMLQLRDLLNVIEEQYAEEFENTDYFAAICKGTLFTYAVDGKTTGGFCL